ncbi:MAG: hypothetical protein MZW92_55075 [Comamonadaceae bacterium]|nr:hypothetical protein [Comamonadaceae bacterium]
MRCLRIEHVATYEYGEVVTLLPHKLLLRPRGGHDIRVESASLTIFPAHHLKWQRDVYGNSVALASFVEPSNRLSIISRLLLQHYEDQPLDFLVADYAAFIFLSVRSRRAGRSGPLSPAGFPVRFAFLKRMVAAVLAVRPAVETYVLLDRINKAIARDFSYQRREQPGVQTPATTLARKSGSCRDFARRCSSRSVAPWG